MSRYPAIFPSIPTGTIPPVAPHLNVITLPADWATNGQTTESHT